MENPHLNTFRRLGARMVGGAYVEGWGLYSERLADEMGLYRDEAERFGMLDAQAWRAARLVVDTGLHALRWERQRSIDFLQTAGLSETDAVIETDRYICWPGQALTYKLGQREIERLRARDLRRATGRASTCARSTTRCSATARCRWRRSPASCPTWVATPGLTPRRPRPGVGRYESKPIPSASSVWRMSPRRPSLRSAGRARGGPSRRRASGAARAGTGSAGS